MNNLDYLVGFSRQKEHKSLAITGHSLFTAFVDAKCYLQTLKNSHFFYIS